MSHFVFSITGQEATAKSQPAICIGFIPSYAYGVGTQMDISCS